MHTMARKRAHHPEDFLADSHLSHRVNRIKAPSNYAVFKGPATL
jgi:hypothetical protein